MTDPNAARPTEARSLGRIVVIAGPTCVGKTTLARGLRENARPHLERTLGLAPGSSYRLVEAKGWRSLEPAGCDALVLHYDFGRSRFSGFARDRALSLLDRAQDLVFLTLWERPEEIEERFRRRRQRVLIHLFRLRFRSAWRSFCWFRCHRALAPRDRIWSLYQSWFAYCGDRDRATHWVLRPTAEDTPRRLSVTPSSPFWETAEA